MRAMILAVRVRVRRTDGDINIGTAGSTRGAHRHWKETTTMRNLDVVAAALVIICALNWGLAGAFHLDLVATLFGMTFGQTSPMSTVVYSLVGLAGLYQALTWKSIQRRWQGMGPATA